MAKELEALVAKSRRCKRPKDQISCAYGLADLSTHRKSTNPTETRILLIFSGAAVGGALAELA